MKASFILFIFILNYSHCRAMDNGQKIQDPINNNVEHSLTEMLPLDLWLHIFEYLPGNDLYLLRVLYHKNNQTSQPKFRITSVICKNIITFLEKKYDNQLDRGRPGSWGYRRVNYTTRHVFINKLKTFFQSAPQQTQDTIKNYFCCRLAEFPNRYSKELNQHKINLCPVACFALIPFNVPCNNLAIAHFMVYDFCIIHNNYNLNELEGSENYWIHIQKNSLLELSNDKKLYFQSFVLLNHKGEGLPPYE